MRLADLLSFSFFSKAASTGGKTGPLPPEPPPVVKPRQATIPPQFPSAEPSKTAVLIKRDLNLANSDALQLRRGATTNDTVRDFVSASPDLSAAMNAMLRLGITERYKMKAWNPDGTFNADATRLAYQIAQRMDMVPNYAEGYNRTNSFLSLSEAMARDGLSTGGMSMELVLDKSRLPAKFVPIATANIVWYPDVAGKTVIPAQLLGGVTTMLDIPAFFYTSIDQDLRTAYSSSPFEPALQPVIADAEFTNDMRRVIKRAVYPRLDISIDEEKLKLSTPPEVLNDPDKLREFRNKVQDDIKGVINGLQPEDALVHYDFLVVQYVDGAMHAPQEVFQGIQDIVNAKLATGAKTLPSVLGHGSGSQNVASSETLLAMKTADGLVRKKLNEMLSKGMTLAVRLFGLDVAVNFEYEEIELRAAGELEAFRAQKQSRILEQLSLGLITDEEACLDLTGSLPPPGMAPLSGTMFMMPAPPADAAGNGYSGTGVGGGQSGGGAGTQKNKTPTAKKQGGSG